jgi:hypothetical protein
VQKWIQLNGYSCQNYYFLMKNYKKIFKKFSSTVSLIFIVQAAHPSYRLWEISVIFGRKFIEFEFTPHLYTSVYINYLNNFQQLIRIIFNFHRYGNKNWKYLNLGFNQICDESIKADNKGGTATKRIMKKRFRREIHADDYVQFSRNFDFLSENDLKMINRLSPKHKLKSPAQFENA